jgi:hypothetical protein
VPKNPQAIKLAISWPIGHHTDKSVSKLPEALGKNSRKRAPSTSNQELAEPNTDWKRNITWEIPTHASTKSSKESTNTDPVGCATSSDAKDTCNEEGHVECKTTPHDIRTYTPE